MTEEQKKVYDTLKPFEQRLIEEYRELDTKLDKLNVFIDPENYSYVSLDLAEQADLVTQSHAMTIYKIALGNRLTRKGLFHVFFPPQEGE